MRSIRNRSRLVLPLSALLLSLLLCLVALPVSAEDEEPEFPHGDFDGDCTQCHGDEWTPLVLDPEFRRSIHPFPLKQAHDLPNCRSCHSKTLDFTKADPECVNCHMDPHRGEFGIDCALCHVPRTFIDRSRMQRAHHLTRFPLRGSHRAVECEDCHHLAASGQMQFVKTETECQACHLNDYLDASDPNHVAAGFPTDCQRCHPPGFWGQGRFNHDSMFFPIYSGEHRNRWDRCSTCHVVSNDLSEFSCFGCHPHSDEAETTSHHDEVLGFIYDSAACFACHPRGKAP